MKSKPKGPGGSVECYELLLELSRSPLPAIYSAQDDIHKILALRSASMLEASTDPSVFLRSGERMIPRAVVTGLTALGRAACMSPGSGYSAWRR